MLTLQNGVDSVAEVAAVAGETPVIGGTTYIATALSAPGVIEQTGTHRRIVFGEVFGALPRLSERVSAIHEALSARTSSPRRSATAACRSGRSSSSSSRSPASPARRGCRSVRSGRDPFVSARFLDGCREIETPGARRRGAGRRRRHRADRDVHRRHPGDDAVVAADRLVAGEEDRGGGAARRRSSAARPRRVCRCRSCRRCTRC